MSITLDGTTGITTPDVETSDGAVYAKGNILGTVSESGGVPTGAIIERGSNANGEFVRYADGAQICFLERIETFGQSTQNTEAIWTYPSEFIDRPALNILIHETGRISAAMTDINFAQTIRPGTASASIRVRGQESGVFTVGTTRIFCSVTAFGRWF